MEEYIQDSGSSIRLRDLEEKHRLLKERTILIGQNLIDEREKTFKTLQELKKEVMILKEESIRMKEFIQKITEQLSKMARREELAIMQKQFDFFRE